MEGEARREKIMETLRREQGPVSGTELAARMGVSRQVIVQDIELLRVSYQVICCMRSRRSAGGAEESSR